MWIALLVLAVLIVLNLLASREVRKGTDLPFSQNMLVACIWVFPFLGLLVAWHNTGQHRVDLPKGEHRPLPDMHIIDSDLMRRVCLILGEESIREVDLETRVLAIADSPMHARRLIDWTREAFGLVLVAHVAKVVMPKTFLAQAANGEWLEFSFDAEPIFRAAFVEASEMIHAGPRSLFENIAACGGMFAAANNALNAGANIDGAVLARPSLLGIPAEVYLPETGVRSHDTH